MSDDQSENVTHEDGTVTAPPVEPGPNAAIIEEGVEHTENSDAEGGPGEAVESTSTGTKVTVPEPPPVVTKTNPDGKPDEPAVDPASFYDSPQVGGSPLSQSAQAAPLSEADTHATPVPSPSEQAELDANAGLDPVPASESAVNTDPPEGAADAAEEPEAPVVEDPFA